MIVNFISLVLLVTISVAFFQASFLNLYPTIKIRESVFIFSIFFIVSLLLFSKFFQYIFPCKIRGGKLFSNITISSTKRKINSLILILVLSISFLLISLFGFYCTITISGIPPISALPYKLNGAVFYLTRYIFPIALIWIYLKNFRGNLNVEIFLSFIFFGASLLGASRFTLLLLFLPILLNYFRKDNYKFFIFLLIFLYMFSSVTTARYSIYEMVEKNIIMNCDYSCLFRLAYPLSIYSYEEFFDPIFKIFDRIESPHTLNYASNYCIECVSPLYETFFRLVCQSCFPIDVNLHHMEWQGFLSPPGIVNNGGLLSVAISLSRISLFYSILFSFSCAMILHYLFINIAIFSNLYRLQAYVLAPVIILSGILFMTDPGGRMLTLMIIFFIFANSLRLVYIISSKEN